MKGYKLTFRGGQELTFTSDGKGGFDLAKPIERLRHCPKCGSNDVEKGEHLMRCLKPGCMISFIGNGKAILHPDDWTHHPTTGKQCTKREVLSS